jgi:mannose-6-phosphate isomerase-like protein (cupin superfamily)
MNDAAQTRPWRSEIDRSGAAAARFDAEIKLKWEIRVKWRNTMSSPIRRVVTGKDETGKAIVITDDAASRVHARKELGVTNTLLWVTDSTPAKLRKQGYAGNREVGVVPPPSGTIFRIVEFGPQRDLQADYQTRLQIFQRIGLAPEGTSRDTPRDPGMHRTQTVDYAVILSGEIDMLLDESEVHLNTGDVVIQQGTNHAWVNRGNEPCKVAFVLIDAQD